MGGRMKLGEMMVRAGLVDELQLNAALAHQRKWGGKLGSVLVELGFVDEDLVWKGLSKQTGLQRIDLPNTPISPHLVARVPLDLVEKHQLFPVAYKDETKNLLVATSDPTNVAGIDEMSFRTGWRISCGLAPEVEVQWAIRRYYRGDPSPCPPLRTRRTVDVPQQQDEDEGEMKITDMSGKTIMKKLSDIAPPPMAAMPPPMAPPPVMAAPAMAAPAFGQPMSMPSGMVFGSPGSVVAQPSTEVPPQVAALRAELEKGNKFLKSMIEMCIARGLFTQEEYLERLRRP
ncbi:MAG: hypothetical protein AB2A00_20210 [Myxococcota bacterium]